MTEGSDEGGSRARQAVRRPEQPGLPVTVGRHPPRDQGRKHAKTQLRLVERARLLDPGPEEGLAVTGDRLVQVRNPWGHTERKGRCGSLLRARTSHKPESPSCVRAGGAARPESGPTGCEMCLCPVMWPAAGPPTATLTSLRVTGRGKSNTWGRSMDPSGCAGKVPARCTWPHLMRLGVQTQTASLEKRC